MGRCPHCGQWGSLVEETVGGEPEAEQKNHRRTSMGQTTNDVGAVPFSKMSLPAYIRTKSGLSELDRVLGGGLVHGSVVLLSGEPGIGKSTLLMQISDALGQDRKVL